MCVQLDVFIAPPRCRVVEPYSHVLSRVTAPKRYYNIIITIINIHVVIAYHAVMRVAGFGHVKFVEKKKHLRKRAKRVPLKGYLDERDTMLSNVVGRTRGRTFG